MQLVPPQRLLCDRLSTARHGQKRSGVRQVSGINRPRKMLVYFLPRLQPNDVHPRSIRLFPPSYLALRLLLLISIESLMLVLHIDRPLSHGCVHQKSSRSESPIFWSHGRMAYLLGGKLPSESLNPSSYAFWCLKTSSSSLDSCIAPRICLQSHESILIEKR